MKEEQQSIEELNNEPVIIDDFEDEFLFQGNTIIFEDENENEDFEEELEYIDKDELSDNITAILENEILEAMKEHTQERFNHLSVTTKMQNGSVVTMTPLNKISSDFEMYLSKEEKDELVKQFYPGLVTHMANKYFSKNSNIEYEELFSEATVGFTKALNTYTMFNKENEVPFKNYACGIIDNTILNYLKSHQIHVSSLGPMLSIDATANNVDDANLGDVIPDTNQASIEEQIVNNQELELASDVVGNMSSYLSDIEEFVVKSYFGLDGVQQLSLTELVCMLHISKYKVKKLIDQAMEKVKLYVNQVY